MAFFLPAKWAGVSILNGGFLFIIGRGCVSQIFKVDGLDLSIRETLILWMLSLVWCSRIPTGQLQSDPLEHDSFFASVLGLDLREAEVMTSLSAVSLIGVPEQHR